MTTNPQQFLSQAATADSLQSTKEDDMLTEFLDTKRADFYRHDGSNGRPSKDTNNIVYHEVELSANGIRRRVDAVVFYRGTEFYLIEVKNSLDDELIGQLLIREELFARSEPLHHFSDQRLTKIALVTNANEELERYVNQEFNIEVRTVDYGL